MPIEISTHSEISSIPQAAWDGCACPDSDECRPVDPFTSYRFLLALEESGSVSADCGWIPNHLVARQDERIIAVMPLYLKLHSHGEFVFDFAWADAFNRAGGSYYPKLQSAVPFTPVTGRRFLCRPGFEMQGTHALARACVKIARRFGVSSVHVTYCTAAEAERLKTSGFLRRIGEQFHWYNAEYTCFDDFLRDLTSAKRKTIRSERRRALEFGGSVELLTGSDIQPEHWDSIWLFYQDTGSRKWGVPYLTRKFFDLIHCTMRDDILLVMCKHDGRYIAGSLHLVGRDTLFGRYWGCIEDHRFLHFELCYYQAIDFAIRERIGKVEAGAQGQHKLLRGYRPEQVHSMHWIAHPQFRSAVRHFLDEERQEVRRDMEILSGMGPFRNREHDAR